MPIKVKFIGKVIPETRVFRNKEAVVNILINSRGIAAQVKLIWQFSFVNKSDYELSIFKAFHSLMSL